MNSFGRTNGGYGAMELDKENYSSGGQRDYKTDAYSTPSKSKTGGGFMSYNEAFQTPAGAFGTNRLNSALGTPFRETASKAPEFDPEAPNAKIQRLEELACFPSNVGPAEIMTAVRTAFERGSHWLHKFEAINVFRVLNRSYPNEIFDIFDQFGEQIEGSFRTKNPLIQKNILLFTLEVLKMKQENISTTLDERILKFFLPPLVDRAISSSKQIREVAKESLSVICQNMLCDTVIIELCELSLDKHFAKANMAFKILAACLSNLGENISKLNLQSIEAIFVVLSRHLNQLRRAGCVDTAVKIAHWFANNMGEGFIKLLQQLINKKMVNVQECEYMAEMATGKSNTGASNFEMSKRKTEQLQIRQELKRKVRGIPENELIEVKPDQATMARASQTPFNNGWLNRGGQQSSNQNQFWR